MQVPPRINRLVGQAMHDYAMLADGDRILVAVSGGVDSLVLALLLHVWQKKAPIRYELLPAHVCMDGTPENPGPSALAITEELAKSGLGLELLAALRPGPDSAANGSREHAVATCFACARNRRNSLFRAARHLGCNKVAQQGKVIRERYGKVANVVLDAIQGMREILSFNMWESICLSYIIKMQIIFARIPK